MSGARANVPNPEPHKQMPMASDLTIMVKFKFLLNCSLAFKSPVFGKVGDAGHNCRDVHKAKTEASDDGIEEDEQGDGVDKTGRQEPKCCHCCPTHTDHVTPVTGGQLTCSWPHKSVDSDLKCQDLLNREKKHLEGCFESDTHFTLRHT